MKDAKKTVIKNPVSDLTLDQINVISIAVKCENSDLQKFFEAIKKNFGKTEFIALSELTKLTDLNKEQILTISKYADKINDVKIAKPQFLPPLYKKSQDLGRSSTPDDERTTTKPHPRNAHRKSKKPKSK